MRARDFALCGTAAVLIALPAIWLGMSGSLGWPVAIGGGLGLLLAMLSAIDLRTQRLPDALTLPLIGTGLGIVALTDTGQLGWRLAAASVGFLTLWGLARLYRAYRGRAGLGLGDAKLLAAAGAWIGLAGLPSVLLIASFAAIAVVAWALWMRWEITAETAIPFGPFLALGFWTVWLYGPLA